MSTWFLFLSIFVALFVQKLVWPLSLSEVTLSKGSPPDESLSTISSLSLSTMRAWRLLRRATRPIIAIRCLFMNLWRSNSRLIVSYDNLSIRLWRWILRLQWPKQAVSRKLLGWIIYLLLTSRLINWWKRMLRTWPLSSCTSFCSSSSSS